MLICLLFLFGFTNSQVIVVDQNGGGDYEHIQDGINASQDGDTVLVYPGIYYENINFTGKNITLASLYLITQDESYIDETVIDGNQQGSVVLFISGEDSTATLCGFNICNGNGTNLHGDDKQGGGIALKDSKATIKKCIIKNNHVSHGGGGICVINSTLHLSGSKVKKNYAFKWGGGIMLASDSQIFFDTLQLNDIYLNYSRSGCDFLKTANCPNIIEFVVDTFTVLNPDHFYISSPDPNWYQLNDILISIQHAKVETVNADLYVNPEGNNSNSGLTSDEPLQSLSYALTKIVSDSLHPNTIYLSNGIYSPSTTNEYFPLRCRSFVSFEGDSMVNTILDAEYTGYHFHGYRYANEIAFTNLSLI
ncbi:MAG: hypothetical protein KAT48_14220, partial [Bacteroidales bacterium]|nr:hypothetical protein [Bacteroidales bacterium]